MFVIFITAVRGINHTRPNIYCKYSNKNGVHLEKKDKTRIARPFLVLPSATFQDSEYVCACAQIKKAISKMFGLRTNGVNLEELKKYIRIYLSVICTVV